MILARVLAAGLIAGLLAGCANYHLGTSGTLPFHSLYVAPVQNKTHVPQAQAPVTTLLRQSLMQEGELELTNQDEADATLEVTLSDYQRNTAATSATNTLNAQSFTVSLTALCTLVDNHTGKIYFKDRPIQVTEESFVLNGDSYSESEYQTVAKLARDLGLRIKETVVSVW
jgi:hypothetical protein